MRALVALGCVLSGASSVLAQEGTPAPAVEQGRTFFGRWVAGRLSIGARMTHLWLEDTRRSDGLGYDNGNLSGNFLGSLWGLDAQQHDVPSPYLEYRVVSAFGLGLAYDRARARTLDWGNEQQTIAAGDGDVEIRGLQGYAFGRYRNRTRFTPYTRLGFAHYWSRFFASPGWALPGRHFEVDGTQGWFLGAGCAVRLIKHVELDASYQRSWVADVAARAYLLKNHHRSGAFPMRGGVVGVGAAYRF